MPLVKSGQDRLGKQYSKAAYSLFPKYRLNEAIGIEDAAHGTQLPC